MAENSKKDPSAVVVPFGKHKGATVAELLTKDPQYADWVLAQGWVAERFAELHAAIMTRGAGTDDTPEHNAIQVRFLDEQFRTAALLASRRGLIEKRLEESKVDDGWSEREKLRKFSSELEALQERITNHSSYVQEAGKPCPWDLEGFEEDAQLHRVKRCNEKLVDTIASTELVSAKIATLNEAIAAIDARRRVLRSAVIFEHRGIDVTVPWAIGTAESVRTSEELAREIYRENPRCTSFELKPSMGDDYPTVMRQMARLGAGVLVLGDYSGRAVSEPDLRRMFEANGRTVVFIRDIEAEMANARDVMANGFGG